MPKRTQLVTGCSSFWEKLEDSIKKLLKELFIANVENSLVIAIDDDKMHYQITMEDSEAPETSQHTMDNRCGFAQHQAVAAVLQSIVGMKFEGKNSTTLKSTENLTMCQFCGNQNHPQNSLTEKKILSNRGYTSFGLVYPILNQSGDIMSSTMAREL